jgi:hypothetical protein
MANQASAFKSSDLGPRNHTSTDSFSSCKLGDIAPDTCPSMSGSAVQQWGGSDQAVRRASRKSATRLKSFHRSAWLGLVLGSVLLAIESNSAAAGPYDTSVVKPDPGSTIALRLKGAIDAVFDTLRLKGAIGAVFDTQGLRRAAAHEKLPSETGFADFGPLE